MLKKAIMAEIIPAIRKCAHCGKTVSIDPLKDITICDKCGETVHNENPENRSGDTDAKSTDSV